MKMPGKQGKKHEDGFTLVEVMISAALLAIALSVMIGSFVAARSSTVAADFRLGALNEARDQMERLLSMSYTNAALGTNTAAGAVAMYQIPGSGFYESSYTVSNSTAFPGTKDIELTVSWTRPRSSATSSLSINTTMSKVIHK